MTADLRFRLIEQVNDELRQHLPYWPTAAVTHAVDALLSVFPSELACNPQGLGLVRELHLRSGPCYRLPDVPAAAAANEEVTP